MRQAADTAATGRRGARRFAAQDCTGFVAATLYSAFTLLCCAGRAAGTLLCALSCLRRESFVAATAPRHHTLLLCSSPPPGLRWPYRRPPAAAAHPTGLARAHQRRAGVVLRRLARLRVASRDGPAPSMDEFLAAPAPAEAAAAPPAPLPCNLAAAGEASQQLPTAHLDALCATAERRIDAFKQRLAAAEALAEQATTLRGQNSALQAALATKEAELARAADALAAEQRETARLRTALFMECAELEMEREEAAAAREESAAACEAVVASRAETAAAREDAADTRADLAAAGAQVVELNRQCRDLLVRLLILSLALRPVSHSDGMSLHPHRAQLRVQAAEDALARERAAASSALAAAHADADPSITRAEIAERALTSTMTKMGQQRDACRLAIAMVIAEVQSTSRARDAAEAAAIAAAHDLDHVNSQVRDVWA